jgi:hypothetical protein
MSQFPVVMEHDYFSSWFPEKIMQLPSVCNWHIVPSPWLLNNLLITFISWREGERAACS